MKIVRFLQYIHYFVYREKGNSSLYPHQEPAPQYCYLLFQLSMIIFLNNQTVVLSSI